ncbi:hypothetical protein [Pyrococcus abyssi]|nr:hypothetical protein [Pyrococcus abyssi]
MEIWISDEEFEAIKRNKEKALEFLNNGDKLRTYLLSLKFKFLMEKLNNLEERLQEVEQEYRKLKAFESRAFEDKEFLLRIRRELSIENSNLRRKLNNESNLSKKSICEDYS